MKPSENPALPAFQKPEYNDILPTLTFLKDMWVGITAWYKGGGIVDSSKANTYLPQEAEEPGEAYEGKLARSRFERRFRDAIDKDFTGLLTQFQLTNVPSEISQHEENFDLRGNSIQVVFRQLDKWALRDGSCFCLVEYPPIDANIQTEADRRASGRRPWIVPIERANIINWRVTYPEGRQQVELIVIREYVSLPVGKYGQAEETRYRVLTPGKYEVYRLDEREGETIAELVEEGKTNLDYIPIVGYSLTELDPLGGDFPLVDLAEMNLEFYQLHSEKREILHKCNCPTFVVNQQTSYAPETDNSNKTITIGPNTALFNVDAKWVEPEGRAIASTQAEEEKLDNAMGRKTLAFLSGEHTPRTATEVIIDSTQSRSNLQAMAAQKESAVSQILKYWAGYEGLDDGGTITIDRNLLKAPIEWSLREVVDAFGQGFISRRLAMLILREKGFFPQDFSEDDLALELALTGESLGVGNETVLG